MEEEIGEEKREVGDEVVRKIFKKVKKEDERQERG